MNFLRKGILVSGGQMFGIFLNMLVGMLFSRALGTNGMGQYELFRSTAVIGATIGALGLGSASIYFLNTLGRDRRQITTVSFRIAVVMGCALAVVLGVIIASNPDYFGDVPLSTLVPFVLGVGGFVSTQILRQILVAHLAGRKLVAADLTNRVVLLIGGGLLCLGRWLTPALAITVFACGHMAATVLLVTMLRRDIDLGMSVHWKLFRQLVGYGLKLAAANVIFLLCAHTTVFLLRYLRKGDFGAVGLYSRAVAVAALVSIVYQSITPLIFSRLTKAELPARTRLAERVGRLGTSFCILSFIALQFVAKYVILLLYGEAFLGAVAPLRILAFSLVLLPLLGAVNSLLASDGKALTTAYILAGAFAVVVTVVLIAVPRLGIAGAAVGALCGNLFSVTVGLAVCAKLYGLRPLQMIGLRPYDIAYVRDALRSKRSGLDGVDSAPVTQDPVETDDDFRAFDDGCEVER